MTNEFCLIWFEASQRWIVIFPFIRVLDRNFPSMGAALAAALQEIDAGESDFDVDEDTGSFYRFVRTAS